MRAPGILRVACSSEQRLAGIAGRFVDHAQVVECVGVAARSVDNGVVGSKGTLCMTSVLKDQTQKIARIHIFWVGSDYMPAYAFCRT